MKEIHEKTISSIFIVPTLEINREQLHKNNFLNAYLKDKDNEIYSEEKYLVFLLFNPKNTEIFKIFIDDEYKRTNQLIDDYNYDNFVVLVYTFKKELKKDLELIKNSQYSKVSDKFKNLFPKEVKDYSVVSHRLLPSLQHMIFEKDKKLMEFWEKYLNTSLISRFNLEVWRSFEIEKETLNINKIIENEKNTKVT